MLYTYIGGGSTDVSVPLYDIFGSTIDLIDPSNPSTFETTYTYDPYGVVTTPNNVRTPGHSCTMAWSSSIPTPGSSIGSRAGMFTTPIRSSSRSPARKAWAVAAGPSRAPSVAPEQIRRSTSVQTYTIW